MKTRVYLSGLGLVLLILLGSVDTARGYYDPGVQRWMNRDPLGEPGAESLQRHISRRGHGQPAEVQEGANLYWFLRNTPPRFIDPDGRPVVAIPIIIIIIEVAKDVVFVCSAVISGVVVGDAINKSKKKERECKEMHGKCVGSGLDCFSCLNYCRHYGSWPEHLCPSSNF